MTFAEEYLKQAAAEVTRYKTLAERAIAQVSDDDLHHAPDPESNSIAVIVQHIAGNLRSRWTDFLTSDGEKPDRNRDGEFVDRGFGRQDLLRTVTIRGEPHSVIRAIERAVSHCSYHCGQIVFLAKAIRSTQWQTLSIARGDSEGYTARLRQVR